MPYEYHNYEHYQDPELKIIFHEDHINSKSLNQLHWHKSPELLLITSGRLTVFCDGIERIYNPNEIAIINNNQLHDMYTNSEKCIYYCLIVDSEIYDNNNSMLSPKCESKEAVSVYKRIVAELTNKKPNYKEAVIGYTKVLFSLISREEFAKDELSKNKRKVKLVKRATQYIYENFTEDITLQEISDYLNTSKYYLSHIFKEITGKTIISHLNYVRCNHAKSLLKSGEYNVAESAYASGFSNLSYFSRIYKNIMGNLPVKDLKER